MNNSKPHSRMKAIISIMIMTAVLMLTLAGTAESALAAGSVTTITAEQATKIALKDAGTKKSKVKKLVCTFEKDVEDGDQYEVRFRKGGYQYEYEILEEVGKIREKEMRLIKKEKKKGKATITKKQAKKTALKKAKIKNPKKLTIKKDKDDGVKIWEVKFRKGSYKYEVEISRVTGKLLKIEKQLLK